MAYSICFDFGVFEELALCFLGLRRTETITISGFGAQSLFVLPFSLYIVLDAFIIFLLRVIMIPKRRGLAKQWPISFISPYGQDM
jgi:hypothetical protein